MKNRKGFTLLEMIMAIAMLAFTSVFILQMFVLSATVNARARNTDAAMAEAVTAVDALKRRADDVEAVVSRYYDKHWQPVADEADARFCLSGGTTPEAFTGGGWLYAVTVAVEDLDADGDKRVLVRLQTQQYIPGA